MFDSDLVREKVMQSVQILKEKDVDAWLTFVRETSQMQDPCMDLMVGVEVAWHSAFIITSKGDRIAIVGRFDRENIELTGAYQQVIGYDESIRPLLVDALNRLQPQCIAINYSENDPAADGLTHGMWATLFRLLEGTQFSACLVSAENIIGALRGRKSPAEIARIRAAIATTDRIFDDMAQVLIAVAAVQRPRTSTCLPSDPRWVSVPPRRGVGQTDRQRAPCPLSRPLRSPRTLPRPRPRSSTSMSKRVVSRRAT